MNTEKDFIYKELTSEIIKASFNVHNAIGCGLLEKFTCMGTGTKR